MPFSDEQLMLIGLARTYLKLRERFGHPGQPTHMQFPSVQGMAMNFAIERIAKSGPEGLRMNPGLVADRIELEIVPPHYGYDASDPAPGDPPQE